jgi:hypothetical protein
MSNRDLEAAWLRKVQVNGSRVGFSYRKELYLVTFILVNVS